MQYFQEGQLDLAVLAFEGEIERDASDSEAWRMLGLSHAENEEDYKAIQCLEKAVDADPYSLDALFALGVSYVNENNTEGALETMRAWIQHNPKFHGLEIELDAYSDGSLFDDVQQLMLKGNFYIISLQ